MTTTPPTSRQADIAARVARGVALLDEQHPGWHDRIDLSSLDLSEPCLCVLGQLYEEYDFGAEALGIVAVEARYGFDVSLRLDTIDSSFETYVDLQAEWVRVITARRGAVAR